jgi:hypothetical protein
METDRTIVWAVDIGPGAEPVIGERREAFVLDKHFLIDYGRWDIGGDGRLLGITEAEPWVHPAQINIVLNWFEELNRRVLGLN